MLLKRLDRAHRALPVALGTTTLAGVGLLVAHDAFPALIPARAHGALGAGTLAAIAVAYVVYQIIRHPRPRELFKAILLAIAFLFWAANQLWADLPQATLFNDLAIALFVLDVFFVIVGWPKSSPDEDFAETFAPDTASDEAGSR